LGEGQSCERLSLPAATAIYLVLYNEKK